MSPDREPFLTVPELAAWLRLDESTVRDHAAKGRLPATRIGGVWRFRASRIQTWIDEQDNQARPRVRVVRATVQRPEPTTGRREAGGRR